VTDGRPAAPVADGGPASDSADDRPTVIRLGQFLKWSGLAASGGEAKARIADGDVRVNGAVETRRRRQLKNGDAVELDGARVVVDVPEDDAAGQSMGS